MHNLRTSIRSDPTEYQIMCGSLAEFHIRPLITCIDDEDFLFPGAHELVFSGHFPVLPRDLSGLPERIICYKIEPYDRYPGFARLRLWGEMKYNWKFKKYILKAVNKMYYAVVNMDKLAQDYTPLTLVQNRTMLSTVSGPAVKRQSDEHSDDFVKNMWCPQWPKEAQVWLNRPRLNGWPATDVISEVAQNGCHFVYVQHRSCRDDKHQWRLSFSLAEVTLLQSWTQIQQIVYHLFRFFAKRELIQKDCPKEDEILCTYHLKTLMLWTCEEMSAEWWNSSSAIAICSELLKKLSDRLKKRHCPNYFIARSE